MMWRVRYLATSKAELLETGDVLSKFPELNLFYFRMEGLRSVSLRSKEHGRVQITKME